MEIIAEIGQNHNGEMSLALELIHAAKENGADVAKFQLYDARKLFPKEGNEWFDYNCKTEITRDQLGVLVEECNKINIEFMASAFDQERITWLEKANVRRHKVASRSLKDTNLLNSFAATGKPLLISLGMWEEEGRFPRIETSADLLFLYCVSKYPTRLSELSFSSIDFCKTYAGFSDHTIGITAAQIAFARGAKTVEKHFTLDKSLYGPDHTGSMTPDELKALHKFRLDVAQCI